MYFSSQKRDVKEITQRADSRVIQVDRPWLKDSRNFTSRLLAKKVTTTVAQLVPFLYLIC